MVQTWESYISKVHKAVPLDPWVTNVELLDIFIQTNRSWFPWQTSKLSRIGSILNLGSKDDASAWTKNVQEPLTAGLRSLQNEASLEPSSMFKAETMADLKASLKSSRSILSSITGGSADANFDLKGSSALNCTVTGVRSCRVLSDALMDLVNPSTANEPPSWRPNTSRPEFRWSSKRGQTIWVVTEVLYASKVKIEADANAEAKGTAKAPKVENLDLSTELTTEKDGVFVVTAAKDGAFPFAFRAEKMEFDAEGNLKGKPMMSRSKSLSKTVKSASKVHMYRSASTILT